MAIRGLLSRLDEQAPGARVRGGDERESILNHLKVLLNARQGGSPSAEQFGIPDFADIVHSFPVAIQTIQRAIKDSIQRFEPRLVQVNVRHVTSENPLVLRYEITAQALRGNSRVPLKLTTQISAGGHVDVNY